MIKFESKYVLRIAFGLLVLVELFFLQYTGIISHWYTSSHDKSNSPTKVLHGVPVNIYSSRHERANPVPIIEPDKKILDKLGNHQHALKLIQLQRYVPPGAPKILCWVNTYHANHKTRARAIRETWGKKCDKLVFLSDIEDKELPSVKINAPATHKALWMKHQECLKYIYHTYGTEYEWFYKADDDTFAFIENLKTYIMSYDITKYPRTRPLLLGHRMTLQNWALKNMAKMAPNVSAKFTALVQHYQRQYPAELYHYTPGGGGYAMNVHYMRRIVRLITSNKCFNSDLVPDDAVISICMDLFYGIKPVDTRDDYERERFHQYSPQRVFFEPTTGRRSYWWKSDHIGIGFKNGTDCCSPSGIAFHYIKPRYMYQIYAAFYGDNN